MRAIKSLRQRVAALETALAERATHGQPGALIHVVHGEITAHDRRVAHDAAAARGLRRVIFVEVHDRSLRPVPPAPSADTRHAPLSWAARIAALPREQQRAAITEALTLGRIDAAEAEKLRAALRDA